MSSTADFSLGKVHSSERLSIMERIVSTPLMRGMRGGGDNREDCVHAFNERGAGRGG